jgi:hypothetical protein
VIISSVTTKDCRTVRVPRVAPFDMKKNSGASRLCSFIYPIYFHLSPTGLFVPPQNFLNRVFEKSCITGKWKLNNGKLKELICRLSFFEVVKLALRFPLSLLFHLIHFPLLELLYINNSCFASSAVVSAFNFAVSFESIFSKICTLIPTALILSRMFTYSDDCFIVDL